jgi:hypothetical protein
MKAIVDSVNKAGPTYNGYIGIARDGEALGQVESKNLSYNDRNLKRKNT